MNRRRLLYLYREINPYNIPVLKEIVRQGFEILVIHETEKKLIPYKIPDIEHITFFPLNSFNQRQLNSLAFNFKPNLAYVSDRTISLYNRTAVQLRKKIRIPVIMGCDTQWHGGKQWFNVLTAWARHKRYYSHIIVAGMRQYEYAKKLGFSNSEILWPLNAADTELFLRPSINIEKFEHPRNFLYVGRIAKVKGLEILLEAWSLIREKKCATLTIVGSGPLKDKLRGHGGVIFHDFMCQEKLKELAEKSSCFVLPSIYEPWALVIHEFAAVGLPIIVTNVCGAAPHFVINNYNGYLIKARSVEALKIAIEKIIDLPDETLNLFARRSRDLARSITPEMVAYAITSILQ